ncbi:hypothetical protein STEG23_029169 [Scotinomys teguina]
MVSMVAVVWIVYAVSGNGSDECGSVCCQCRSDGVDQYAVSEWPGDECVDRYLSMSKRSSVDRYTVNGKREVMSVDQYAVNDNE